MYKRTVFLSVVALVVITLLLAACGGGGGGGAAPAPTAQGDAKAGAQTWAAQPCPSCHGANAEGGVGRKLAGTTLTLDQVKNTVRNGRGGGMPKFGPDQVSDADIANIYAWLKTLK